MKQTTSDIVRVRFAPSPTGGLHIGGARTALLNYLFARRAGGKLFLRIEDTDVERALAGAVEALQADLDWLGIRFDDWSDGETLHSQQNLLRQSQRQTRYAQIAAELQSRSATYKCWCPPERLTLLRQNAAQKNLPPRYDKHCLRLAQSEIDEFTALGRPYVVRLKMLDKPVVIDDLFKETVAFAGRNLDDPILIRSDGAATSILAGVVDDHDMGITHILRGEEWLPSTPYQKFIFEALAWPTPCWGHLSMLLDESGRKLSKRIGNATVEEIRVAGVLPQALCRYIAGLGRGNLKPDAGWTLESLAQDFDAEAYRSGEIIYAHTALLGENQRFIQRLSDRELWDSLASQLIERYPEMRARSDERQVAAIHLGREGAKTTRQIIDNLSCIIERPNLATVDFSLQTRATFVIAAYIDELKNNNSGWDKDVAKRFLENVAVRTGLKGAALFTSLRLTLTGQPHGPKLTDIIGFLGREECLERAKKAIIFLKG